MLVSIVIPNWNGRALLEPCLKSLRAQTHPNLETIVVDNASSDESVSFLRTHHPEVRLVELAANRGFAFATNAGIRSASGSCVALLNNDVVVEPKWLEELLTCAERHPDAAGIASKVLVLGEERVIDRAGDVVSRAFRAYPRAQGQPDEGQVDEEVEVFAASGAASLWRTKVLHELGLLDEDLFFTYEDVDLSFRARLVGYECWYAPHAVARHMGGATARRWPDLVHFQSTRNRWRMIVKDVPTRLLLRNLHHIVFAEALTIGRSARDRNLRVLLGAYRDVLTSLPDWRVERREVQGGRRVGDAVIAAALTSSHPGLGRLRESFDA